MKCPVTPGSLIYQCIKPSSQYDADSCVTCGTEWATYCEQIYVSPLGSDRSQRSYTLGINLSYIPAEPNVKLKGNRHVTQINSQLTVYLNSLNFRLVNFRQNKFPEKKNSYEKIKGK